MDESRLCVPHSLTDTADPALMALTSCTNTLGRGRGRRGLSCSLPDVEFPPQISCPAAPASGALVYLSDFAYAKKKKKVLSKLTFTANRSRILGNFFSPLPLIKLLICLNILYAE